jgi:hypothetical protein
LPGPDFPLQDAMAASGYGLAEAGDLPGKYRLGRLLGGHGALLLAERIGSSAAAVAAASPAIFASYPGSLAAARAATTTPTGRAAPRSSFHSLAAAWPR